jgi:hypothetical protein
MHVMPPKMGIQLEIGALQFYLSQQQKAQRHLNAPSSENHIGRQQVNSRMYTLQQYQQDQSHPLVS